MIKTITKKKKFKGENVCLRKPYSEQMREEKPKTRSKEKIYLYECGVPKNSKERQ